MELTKGGKKDQLRSTSAKKQVRLEQLVRSDYASSFIFGGGRKVGESASKSSNVELAAVARLIQNKQLEYHPRLIYWIHSITTLIIRSQA